jgi:fibronectin type 3 domain-containing protein
LYPRTFAFIFAAMGLAAAASAADRRQNYDELTRASDKVLLGTVGVKSSRWADDSRIVTDVLIYPDVTIKGGDEGPVTVEILGGTVGDTVMTVSDGPEFPDGERVLVFLKREGGRYVVSGRAAGTVRASRAEAAEAAEAAMGTVEQATGRGMAYQRGTVTAHLNQAATRSAAQVGCYNIDGAKWATLPATYKIGTTIPVDWTAAIDASTATWNAAGTSFKFAKDSTSANELSYKDLVAAYGSSYSNTFAVTTTWSSRTTGIISKATIEVNTKYQWSASGEAGKADVQNIMTHEFGHWMRLLDIYSPTSCGEVTMWGSATYGETKKRTLEQPDLDGLFALYPGSGTLAAPALTTPANGATNISLTPSLQWNASNGATGYDVYFGTSASPALAATVTGTTYAPGTLTAGKTYYWKVTAKNAASSASSGTWTFTVSGAAGAVAAPTLASPGNGATGVSTTPALTWTAAANATAYEVYLGTTNPPALAVSTPGTTYSPATLTAGATYYWRVVAKNSTSSATSATWSFTVAGAAATVTAPTLMAPANAATGVSRTPLLSWTTQANATSYDVYLGTSTNPGLAGTITGTSAQVSTLTAGATYYWRVVAKNSTSSATSPTWSFTVAVSAPATPALTAPANGATGVTATTTLTWATSAGATSYDVYLGASTSPALVGTVTGTSFPASGLTAGATYYWRVVAKNSGGSATSATWSFTVAAANSSGLTLLSPKDGATGVSTRPVMQWSAVTGATMYDLYVGMSASPAYIGSVNATSVTVSGFKAQSTYYWKVIARTAGGQVSSAVASFKTGNQ